MDAQIVWQKGLSFTGSSDTGFTLPLGASKDVGGEDDGFRPLELIAISLAGCTGMDVISILQKKRQQISLFKVHVQAERAPDHPRVFTHASIHYEITGHQVDEKAVIRSLELSATQYCPAQAMLMKVFPIDLKYSIYEGLTEDSRELVKSGSYTIH